MKFLIACGIYPPEIGGPATVIANLVRDLRAAGHEALVVTYGEMNVGAQFIAPNTKDVPNDNAFNDVIRVSRKGSVFARYMRYTLAVRKYLTPDVRLVATDVFSVGIPTRFALIGKKNALFVRLGGEWAWEDAVTNGGVRVTLREYWTAHAQGSRHLLKRALYRWVLGRASRVMPTSDLLTEILEKILPGVAKRIVVVSNATESILKNAAVNTRDTSVLESKLPDAPGIDVSKSRKILFETSMPSAFLTEDENKKLRLITVGRFAPVKNMPFFARVLKQCIDQGVAVACTFVGDGEELEETREILKDVPGMDFVGKKNQTEIQELLSQSDVLVLPSLSDVCPNSVIEALAHGVPCLITTEHGLPKPLHGVVECSPRDQSEWVQRIVQLSDASTYNALRNAVQPVPSAGSSLFQAVTQAI